MAPGIQPGGVVIPTKGIDGISEAQASMSEGWASLGRGLGEWATFAETVQTTGELSEFQNILQQTDEQARTELQKRDDITDYASTWAQTCEPRISEAMKGLSAPAREQAEQLAADFRRRGMLEAERIGGLGKLDKARSQWNAGLKLATERGDADAVERQLEAGKQIFVPESMLPQKRAQALDAACMARWNRRWKENPAQAMAAMDAGEDEPSTPEMRETLQRMNRNSRQAFKSDFASMWVEMDARNAVLDPKSLQLAQKAGLINDVQARQYVDGQGASPAGVDEASLSQWKRRIDTMDDDDEALAEVRIGVVASGLPGKVRRELTKRIETVRQLPTADRKRMNDCLDRFYREGHLGAPGDAESWRKKSYIQDQLIAKCAGQGVDEAMKFLADMAATGTGWVCFNPPVTK